MTEATHSRRISNRPSKRKILDGESKENEKKVRSCDKAGCFATKPTCCLLSLDSCSVSGYTSRWYHMSLGEHFCNNCFDNFYRPSKTGNQQFSKWSNEWGSVARASKPTIKRFVANELLPYWVKCSHRQCGKWRMVRKPDILSPKFIENFKCPPQPGSKSACDVAEEKDVSLVLDSTFMPQLAEEPLLLNSPAASFLMRFLPEDVGVCPIDCSESSFEKPDNIEPFLEGQCGKSTIWVSPDKMDEDEIAFAQQVLVSPATYLGLRNFLVTIWNLNPSEWLCLKKISKYLVCRGLVRIYLLSVAEQILDLLTKKAVINFGIIQNPSLKQLVKNFKPKVLVIGAGVSGLAAASHLKNLGLDVTVFEAESDLGGRVKDVPTLGSGAFFIEGLVNNPFTILSIQAKAECQILQKEVVMFKSNGEVVPCHVASTAQDELNGLFMGAVESVNVGKEDINLYEILMQGFNSMQKMTNSCSEPDVFNHLLAQNEIQCKIDMRNLSTLNWEFTMALSGESAFIPNGLRLLLIKLSRSVNVLYNEQVKAIDYAGNEVNVTMYDGREIPFSKVLVTVPLAMLQNDSIEFAPPLPSFKKKAIEDLGNFYCEKLILEFPKKFWTNTTIETPFSTFGIVSSKQIFEVFIDITNKKANSKPTLVTFITQKSMKFTDELDDKEIVDECMMLLKSVFGRSVQQPTKWFLTHWRKGRQSGPYGSYLKVGSNQSSYDDMASSVNDKLYFAGEATFRNIPSTITGAYLSGLREAAKIVKDFKL